jgi:alpha,alpha-trehalase
MDNSPAWDKALQRVEAVNNSGHKRRDLQQVNQAQRPSQMDYNRYMALVELFSSLKYEPEALYEQSTFKVIDLGVNSLLQRSNIDLLSLAQQFGSLEEQAEIEMRINLTRQAFQRLWSPELSIYLNWDCITNTPIEIPVAAGFLPLFARIPDEKQAKQMSYELSRWSDLCRYLVPSCSPDSADFEAKRYWRGPVWFIVNWMIGEGLEHYGQTALSEQIRQNSKELVELSGFFEYYDPQDSSGLGGGEFSWTAAIFLHWLSE